MDKYIIRDSKHLLFWEGQFKKDTTIFDDVTSILYDRIKALQEKINNNYDVSINIALNSELSKLEAVIDRYINQIDNVAEIMVDIAEMQCISEDKITIIE